MVVGVFLVSAASPAVAQRLDLNAFYFTIRHLIMLMPAFLIMITASLLTPRLVWRVAICVLIGAFIAMVAVLFGGNEIKGAKRWIALFGFSLQPSEFAKPAFVIVAAWLISMQQEKMNLSDRPVLPGKGRFDRYAHFVDYMVCGGFYAIYLGLLALQPDIGMAFVVTAIFGLQIFLAGMKLRWLMVAMGGIVALIMLAYMVFGHVQSRFDRFFNPEQGDTYQIEKSLEAFRNGGIIGTGPGQGTVKLHLPDSHADFIFSVAGEELGFFFVIALMGLYVFIVIRGLGKIMESDNLFTVLAVAGLLMQLALQAFIHMGSSLNILPTKGMTLPLISYGGSSLWAMAFAMGAVLALTRKHNRFTHYGG